MKIKIKKSCWWHKYKKLYIVMEKIISHPGCCEFIRYLSLYPKEYSISQNDGKICIKCKKIKNNNVDISVYTYKIGMWESYNVYTVKDYSLVFNELNKDSAS